MESAAIGFTGPSFASYERPVSLLMFHQLDTLQQ